MYIVYWENIISQHKLPYWQKIKVVDSRYHLTVVVPEILNRELQAQGWEIKKEGEFAILEKPSEDEIQQIFQNSSSDTVHVFSGIRANPFVFTAFKQSLKQKELKRVLLTESVNLEGIRFITRRLASIFIERKYRKYFDFVLASGKNTPAWYLECGFKREQIVPFMYSIDPLSELKVKSNSEHVKIVFIGQLIKRKGLDFLIKSLSSLKRKDWILDIYGKGKLEDELHSLAAKKQLTDQVSFKGVLENEQMKKQLSNYDLLVLPSRFDGWGAVVNEAIAAGIRVICSSACGASVLIKDDSIGNVFRKNSILDLSKKLKVQLDKGPVSQQEGNSIHNYAQSLSGIQVAKYLIGILDFQYNTEGRLPKAPWQE